MGLEIPVVINTSLKLIGIKVSLMAIFNNLRSNCFYSFVIVLFKHR